MKKTKLFLLIAICLFTFMLTSCKKKTDGISINTISSITMNVDEVADLSIVYNTNKYYDEKAIFENLQFSGFDKNIIELDGLKIKGKAPGTTKIKISWDEANINKEVVVTIATPLIGEITIDESLTLAPSEELKVKVNTSNNLTVKWKSNDENIVTVKDGLLTGKAEGTTTIEVTFSNGYLEEKRIINVVVRYIRYTITYILNGATNDQNNPSSFIEGSTVNLLPPTLEGYKFLGWYMGDTLVETINDTIKENITLTARFEYIKKNFNITYILNGGTNNELNPTTFTEGDTITLKEATRDGYKFMGWMLNGKIVENTFNTPSQDITLEASWEVLPKVKANYNLDGGSFGWTVNEVVNPKEGINNYSTLPTIFKQDFYYYLKTNKLLDSSVVNEKFIDLGFTFEGFNKNYDDPHDIYNWTSTGYYKAADGYQQLFWDKIENGIASGGFFGTSPYKEKYQKLLTMVLQMTDIKYSDLTSNYNIPSYKAGFGFVLDGYFYGTQGLMSSGASYETFNKLRKTIPSCNEVLQEAEYGETLYLESPVRIGYIFLGWYDNVNLKGEKLTKISKTTDLYAKWYDLNKKPNTYQITYHLDGGTLSSNITSYVEQIGVAILPQATKQGYRFLGWTYKRGDKTYITSISRYEETDIVLYANYEEIDDLTITYIYTDGNTPTHVATSLDEFMNVFFKEFHAWSKSTQPLAQFKSSAMASWAKGSAGGYKVYKGGGENEVDNDYFVNAKGNERWYEWFKIFNEQVHNINATQTAWASEYVGYLRLSTLFNKSASYWKESYVKACYEGYPIHDELIVSFKPGDDISLVPLVVDDGRTFLGWFDENDNLVTSTKSLTKDITLYGKFSESTPMESFEITNKIDKILRFESHQLTWKILPDNTTNKKLKFSSSNENVLTIDEEGLMYAKAEGTTTVKVTVLDNDSFSVTFDVTVYVDTYIDASFENNILTVGSTTTVSSVVKSGKGKILYKSLDPSVIAIDEFGTVTALKQGYGVIKAYLEENENVNLTVGVTVIDASTNEIFEVIRKAHNEEIHVMRALNVAYAYLTDVYSSVSDLLYNYDYNVDTSLIIPTKNGNRPTTKISSMEFITIHYTAGTPKTSDARATANFFNNPQTEASANYCTGNDGIYMTIPDGEVAYHAGDGTKTKFFWTNTGVKATENVKPNWGVTKNSNSSSGYYFTLNGVATTIEVPTQGYTSGGTLKTMTDPGSRFTFYGPAWKVVDGYYYMGNTWACFTQTLAGAISSRGGNLNSVGIETACNRGSDLWYTYQITAQLVARLLDKYNLDTTRVVGHNMFSGKDCPQTLLAEGGELWYPFMECVEAENALYKLKLSDNYKITCKSNDPEFVSDNGRVIKIPNYTKSVSYTVTVTNTLTNESQSETYSTIIHGVYTE